MSDKRKTEDKSRKKTRVVKLDVKARPQSANKARPAAENKALGQ